MHMHILHDAVGYRACTQEEDKLMSYRNNIDWVSIRVAQIAMRHCESQSPSQHIHLHYKIIHTVC